MLGQARRGPRHRLGRTPDGEVILVVFAPPLGDQTVRFQALVGNHRHAIVILDHGDAAAGSDHVRQLGDERPTTAVKGLAARIQVGVAIEVGGCEVAAGTYVRRWIAGSRRGVRAGEKHVLFADVVGHHFVIDDDGVKDIVEVALGVGTDRDDLGAGEIEDGVIRGCRDAPQGTKAGQLLGGLRVDRANAGPGMGAAQYLGEQHAGAIDVEAVFGPAGGLIGTIQPLMLATDDAANGGPGHGTSPFVGAVFSDQSSVNSHQ